MSCLQGRPAANALQELVGWTGAVQLTPGCAPSADLADVLARRRPRIRTHHGFTPHAMRRPVWGPDGALLTADHSVHPPRLGHPAAEGWADEIERSDVTVEVMYPGYHLGTGREIEMAMERRLPLAVDVSHLWIQRSAGVLSRRTWRRIRRYGRVTEIHLSDNDGRRDLHRPVTADTFGLGWARDRADDGIPVVLECRFHHLDDATRAAQVELCGGTT